MSEKIPPSLPTLQLVYAGEPITVQCVPRRVVKGRLLIKVHPDGRVVASVPPETTEQAMLSALKKRSRWIYQQLRDFRAQQAHVIPRQYVSGESHYYLGKQYQLKVTEAPTLPQKVKMLRGCLEVTVRHKSAEKVQSLLADWYRERAREVFQRRLDILVPQTLWVSERPPIRLRAMQTQWGNCSAKGYLTLNPWLVKAPSDCIDYVLLHELCHVAEHNHSDAFYRLMGQVMPGWEKVKKRLDGMAEMVLSGMVQTEENA
ncbi:M48 family metallopeptidase [Klebsiella quasipneumoniae subsp. similipneumoniae]|uniref:M48 family metallopeptidase n=1 Tax=Klebsiella quasipneumoniae TaxID=1463165 RepID=UPI001FB6D51E|nr:SprT family zinc-dependent metalloprotease [Klebsiella quasipneumoniae]MCJ1843776.1 M48 family metallopeptidase [Klebsiella quasipneumoniae subsp. similipneumoniae]